MTVLSDTNGLIWLLNSKVGGKLGPESKRLLKITDTIYVSSISIV
jgi:PIN domain nuclease of toxin-antitoxin system